MNSPFVQLALLLSPGRVADLSDPTGAHDADGSDFDALALDRLLRALRWDWSPAPRRDVLPAAAKELRRA